MDLVIAAVFFFAHSNTPCRTPKSPPASAASVHLRDESPLLERHATRFPTRKAINHAIGVTQTTPGYPAKDRSRTIASHGTNWHSGVSMMTRKSSPLAGRDDVIECLAPE